MGQPKQSEVLDTRLYDELVGYIIREAWEKEGQNLQYADVKLIIELRNSFLNDPDINKAINEIAELKTKEYFLRKDE